LILIRFKLLPENIGSRQNTLYLIYWNAQKELSSTCKQAKGDKKEIGINEFKTML